METTAAATAATARVAVAVAPGDSPRGDEAAAVEAVEMEAGVAGVAVER